MKTVIIGGVAGGASAAARLRRLDETAKIVVLEKGNYISYANCGLPYYIGGEITDKNSLTLLTPADFETRFNIEVKTNHEALFIDVNKKIIKVKDYKTNTEYEETYDTLILSPGAEPVRPSLAGIDDRRIFTLRNIPDTYKIKEYITEHNPKTAVIVGGGYIGVEMAENLTKSGIKTTIIQRPDHLIKTLDYDMACDVHSYLYSKGIDLILGGSVQAFHPKEKTLEIILKDRTLNADIVLLSVGVNPDTNIAKNAGLSLTPKGAIIVDEHMRTSIDGIYAVGDAVEVKNYITKQPAHIPLAGPANKQGRIAADNICGINSVYKGTQGTSVLKIFDMTVSTTGITEQNAKDMGYDYDKMFTLSPSHATYYPGATSMSIKTIFERTTGKILGAQIVGFGGVDKRNDVFSSAIRGALTAFDLCELELSYAPPFSSAKDPVNMAGFAIENVLTGKIKQYHWHDVPALKEDSSVTILDVRTSQENFYGYIEGAINIPLDKLRDNISKIDKSKPIYVYCHSGLRSYIACRILTQNGFNCYNLSGGYRLYTSIMEDKPYDSTPCHACGVKI